MFMRKAFAIAAAIAVANEFKSEAVLLRTKVQVDDKGLPVNPTLPVQNGDLEAALSEANNNAGAADDSEATVAEEEFVNVSIDSDGIDLAQLEEGQVGNVGSKTPEAPADGARTKSLFHFLQEHYGKLSIFLIGAVLLSIFVFDSTSAPTAGHVPTDPFNTATDLFPALQRRLNCTSEGCVHDKLEQIAGFNPVTDDTPSCDALKGTCTNFYTVPRFFTDFSDVNPKFSSENAALIHLAFSIAHARKETALFKACSEYTMIPSTNQITGEKMPCPPGAGNCRETDDGYMDPKGHFVDKKWGGRIAKIGDAETTGFGYSSAQAAKRGFQGDGLYCKDMSGKLVEFPEHGCKDPYGNALTGEMAKECYYGRGLKQLSFPHNYGQFNELLGTWMKQAGRNAPDFCHFPDAICDNPELAVKSGLLFIKNALQEEGDSWRYFSKWMDAIGPQNNGGNQDRVDDAQILADAFDLECNVDGQSERGGVQYDNLVCADAPVQVQATPSPTPASGEPTGSTCYDNVELCTRDSDCDGDAKPFEVHVTQAVPTGCSCGTSYADAVKNQVRCGQPPADTSADSTCTKAKTDEYCRCKYSNPALKAFEHNGHGKCGCGTSWKDANNNPDKICE